MTNTPASSPQDAADVLQHVESVRHQTRSLLQAFWFPLVVFGALTLASALVQWVWAGPVVGLYWAVAGVLGGLVVGLYYRSRELRLGLTTSATPYMLTAVGLMAGAFLLPAITSGDLQQVSSTFAVAAGYLVFAGLDRSRTLAGLAVVMVIVPILVLASGVDHPGAVNAAAVGALTLAVGVASRRPA
ncbi:MAG TPA: hypothetical protein VM942_08145 [Acidimicrobiales bacterium]|nr:hypothetical protein [Acidimicrobiales bacterium]